MTLYYTEESFLHPNYYCVVEDCSSLTEWLAEREITNEIIIEGLFIKFENLELRKKLRETRIYQLSGLYDKCLEVVRSQIIFGDNVREEESQIGWYTIPLIGEYTVILPDTKYWFFVKRHLYNLEPYSDIFVQKEKLEGEREYLKLKGEKVVFYIADNSIFAVISEPIQELIEQSRKYMESITVRKRKLKIHKQNEEESLSRILP